ncbi:type II toxin-antitoxin system RelE/ParE family toxin [Alkalimonas mucilaginosa]|uniref:Type II toxin-antitoxin system RelE/ParE family toxin n=1 Tax=Alkalimonas mucilaginosa TaxID=3057676 RepID=A0ABU7JD15_9GAMM|nr:type II toxin-antitoxin system RelE/ParE family toxin [Alkalimonas sp. MEB004]MEE2023050.1 type II toxin-antitoxin system RelE/ParE family toxin [Alkalimonas sp. MEB004]
MKLEWSPLALERVRDIASYIALDKPLAAEAWVEGLFESVERLVTHPMSGRKVPEAGIERIREIIYGAYRVIYGIDAPAQKISVLTVRRGSEILRVNELE